MPAAVILLAMFERDPACFSPLEPLLFLKGFMALCTYRVSQPDSGIDGRRWLALYLQSISSEVFSTDIHPAARIGCGILLDHATSFVVGETAIIEDDVSILHEVTLGGTGKATGDRHPDHPLRGPDWRRRERFLGAWKSVLMRRLARVAWCLSDVPAAFTTVAGVPAVVVGEKRGRPIQPWK